MELCLTLRMILLRRRREQRRWARQLEEMQRHVIWHRNLRDMTNPFEISESSFLARYRMSKEVACNLVEELRPYIRAHKRATAIPLHLKVLTTLNFFGHGTDQKGIGAYKSPGISQSSICRCIDDVVRALNAPDVLRAGVSFPQTREDRFITMQRNFRHSSMNGVIGYVDGVHIRIITPDRLKDHYVNCHGTHSLNVQVTCDSDMTIINILARYPGALSDAFVWENSALRAKMEELYRGGEECWLLGDSAYPHEPWLHIPVTDPLPNSREATFNQAHMAARSVVERTIQHLRNRFKCLHEDKVLWYDPVKAGLITNACAVLHNKCIRAHVPVPQTDTVDRNSSNDDQPPPTVNQDYETERLLQEAQVVRAEIIAKLPPLPSPAPHNPHRPH